MIRFPLANNHEAEAMVRLRFSPKRSHHSIPLKGRESFGLRIVRSQPGVFDAYTVRLPPTPIGK